MAKEKWDLGKELMQCLAFAHFAVYKYSLRESAQHEQSFYDLFDPDIQNSEIELRKYKNHLGENFDFDRVFDNWETTLTPSTNEKSVDISVKIVYDVAKTLYQKNLISRNFHMYEFLDQTDSFMKVIKTNCLDKIIKALKLPIKGDILSSADIYIVKKAEKNTIKKDFQDEILSKSDIYLINNFDKYNQILEEYWEKHSLFGVSLKLPSTNGTKNIKVVGNPNNAVAKKMLKAVDPYSKFMAMLSDPTTDIDKVIDETVFLHTKIDVNRIGQWKFPVTFRYKRLGLYQSDVKFNLMAWPKAQKDGGGTAGFNGQFFNTPGYSTQWVGGTGVRTLEEFLFQYPQFNKINNELISIRRKALNYALTGSVNKSPNLTQQITAEIEVSKPYGVGLEPKYRKLKTTGKNKDTITPYNKEGMYSRMQYKKGSHGKYDYGANPSKTTQNYKMKIRNIQTLYERAKRELSQPVFAVGASRQDKLLKFISEYENITQKQGILNTYRVAVVNLILNNPITSGMNNSDSMIKTHYENAQISYFLTRGGMKMHRYLKQRIFLTVFGVITKKAYKVYLQRNPEGIFNSRQIIGAIKAQVTKSMVKNIKEFDTVPHFYMS
jgi:hypothetical protein